MSVTMQPRELSKDLLQGAREIATFTGFPERKVYYLVANHRIPGCWVDGKMLLGLKSKIREGLEAKATGKVA